MTTELWLVALFHSAVNFRSWDGTLMASAHRTQQMFGGSTVYTEAQFSVGTFDVSVGQNGVRMREISTLSTILYK